MSPSQPGFRDVWVEVHPSPDRWRHCRQSVTGEDVSGSIDVLLVVNRISTGNGIQVNVHGSFHGTLTGNLGNTYQISAEGQDQADAVSSFYDFPFSVDAISRGSAPNLTLDGVARVAVDGNGDPVGGTIVSVTPNCQ